MDVSLIDMEPGLFKDAFALFCVSEGDGCAMSVSPSDLFLILRSLKAYYLTLPSGSGLAHDCDELFSRLNFYVSECSDRGLFE